MSYLKLSLAILVLALLAGCSGSGSKSSSRYSISQDRGPDKQVDLSKVADAVPRLEPRSRGGNKSPYEVWGKRYYVMPSSEGYRQQGTASWYGKKFHGHKTSNGEIYDMYGMSAAHKSLPLPSYVRVTNLDNNRSVVVRVNDRGPFHGSRLIDLSYAAAYKLNMLKKGTARVEVEAINPQGYSVSQLVTEAQPGLGAPVKEASQFAASGSTRQYIQVGAYSSWAAAQTVKTQLESLDKGLQVLIRKREGTNPVYRVQMGPVEKSSPMEEVFSALRSAGFADFRLINFP
ncbi:septal ring lytic transglycosylase RlpA family protein [Motiliproteus sp. MSK22-1]|uniref:septal ring lytic transglycosylase RlpA family protein n=1 Tax=Motiliproteus sp. MSK22-1 TaxID=1897630 RepID=UPI001E489566|nr:septal ring lytic transglycosylase RlpA family protein [Motiliproteus sp. MSK22-1]